MHLSSACLTCGRTASLRGVTRQHHLPVINLLRPGASQEISKACGQEGPGFFYLTMNSEEAAAASRLLELSRRFFALDKKTKLDLQNDEGQFFRYDGWRVPGSGPGYRAVAGDVNFLNDMRESYNIGWDTSEHNSPPYGPTRWPTPDTLPDFRDACDSYAQLLTAKSRLLCRHIAEALGEQTDYFDAPGLFDCAPWLLGMVHYLPVVSDVAEHRYGIAPHQDDGIFTLLYTDGGPGLQICPSWLGSSVHREEAMHDPNLSWIDVEPLEGHWIVNLGTMLQRWTNGKFKATLHRVVLKGPADRYSLPFFYEANLNAQIKSLPSCREAAVELNDVQQTTPGDLLLLLARRDGIHLVPDRTPTEKYIEL